MSKYHESLRTRMSPTLRCDLHGTTRCVEPRLPFSFAGRRLVVLPVRDGVEDFSDAGNSEPPQAACVGPHDRRA